MPFFTPKQLALRIQPELKSRKIGENTQVYLGDEVISSSHTAFSAWRAAYDALASNQFKVGDLVVLVECVEASCEQYKGKVWKCRRGSFKTQHGDYGVFVEGVDGYFNSAYMRHATPEEALNYEPQTNAVA